MLEAPSSAVEHLVAYQSGYQSAPSEPNMPEKDEKALFRKQQEEHNEAMEKSRAKRYKNELPLYKGAEKGTKAKARD